MYDKEAFKVSVVVPIYNMEKYLKKCIESIINQTYHNIEVILVDDGSNDTSPNICDYFSRIDDRIKVIHKSNGGLSDARNCGIKSATGEYIMFVDSDDYIDCKTIEILVENIIKNEAEMVVHSLKFVDENGYEVDYRKPIDSENKIFNEYEFWKYIYSNPDRYILGVISCNKLMKKSIFEDVLYPVGKIHEDELILHKLLNKSKKIVFIKDKFYNYLQRENSIMGSSYSVRNLDYAEASINRGLYLYYKNWQSLSEKALLWSIGSAMEAYSTLNLSKEENARRLDEIIELYRRAYKIIARGPKSSCRFRLNGLTFYIGPGFYKITHLLKD